MDLLKGLFGGSTVPQIPPHDVKQRMAEGAVLIDVREPDEWRGGHAPGARHVPLGQLARHLPTLPREKDILFICRSGNRSGRATEMARAAGLSATNVSGGMLAWAYAGLPVQQG